MPLYATNLQLVFPTLTIWFFDHFLKDLLSPVFHLFQITSVFLSFLFFFFLLIFFFLTKKIFFGENLFYNFNCFLKKVCLSIFFSFAPFKIRVILIYLSDNKKMRSFKSFCSKFLNLTQNIFFLSTYFFLLF